MKPNLPRPPTADEENRSNEDQPGRTREDEPSRDKRDDQPVSA
jgi:hypothetical protein